MWVDMLSWISRVWSSKECVCCASDSSVYLDVPPIGFAGVFVCRKSFSSLRAGSHVITVYSHHVLTFYDRDTMLLGNRLQLLCIFPLSKLCLSDIRMMFGKIIPAMYTLV